MSFFLDRPFKISQPAGETRVNLKELFTLSLASIGLFSATTANAQQDERQRFPQVSTMSPHGVDLQSGRYVKEGTDLVMGPLSVDHYVHRKMPAAAGGHREFSVFATGLHGSVHQATMPGAGGSNITTAHVHVGKQKLLFHVLGNGSFFPLDSSNTGWKMVRSGTNYILSSKSGDTYTFKTHAGIPALERRLDNMTSANGHKLTYTYDTAGKLTTVKSNRGYAVRLQYSGNNVIVCGINLTVTALPSTCTGSSYKITYGRDSAGKLTSITGVDGAVTGIQYVAYYGSVLISCVTLPGSSTCAITNTYDGVGQGGQNPDQVSTQTTANGELWNYDHIPIESNGPDYTPYPGEILQSFGEMYPPAGAPTNAVFENGFVKTITGPEGLTRYDYSTLGAYQVAYSSGWSSIHYYSVFPQRITYPEGNSAYFTRDWADNVTGRADTPKGGSGLTNNTTTWTYPTSYQWATPTICAAANVLCDKPTKVTDPRGNATDYTYHATHGGMLTKTEPAVNGIRPQTRYTYTARYGRDLNGTAMQPPIYVLTSEEYCKTTAASGASCVGGAADEVVTTYDYGPTSGPNNLLLRGTVADSGGLNLRTCYKYDQYGRKIAETQPLGTGSTCP